MIGKKKIIYISYNGMNEALGASQVLSYLYKLSNDYEYHLVSLEKPRDFSDKEKMVKLKNNLTEASIFWYPIEYKTDKIGKLFNFFKLLVKSRSIVKQNRIKYAHCRSYFPAMVAYILGLKYLFDTRGFAFDERADVGAIRRNGVIFKLLKKIEKQLYLKAAGVNKLSYEGKRTIESNELFHGSERVSPVTVIPTCVDLDRFRYIERDYSGPVKIGYVGTAVGWYDFDKALATLNEIGNQVDYRFIIFNGGQHEYIRSKLSQYQIPADGVVLESVPFEEMPYRLGEIEIALFYIHPYFSKRASAATKLGELFASGIPVLTNGNVGDHEYYISTYGTGHILDFNHLEAYDFNAIIKALRNPRISKKCRHLAEKHFSASHGVDEYRALYTEIF